MSALPIIGVIISQLRAATMTFISLTSSAAIASKIAGERELRTAPQVTVIAIQSER